MQPSQHLFNRDILVQHRRRATANGLADFLHREAAAQVSERLQEINKSFTKPAFVGWLPEVWQSEIMPMAVVDDTDTIPLQVGAHNLVIHGLSLHNANDPVGQLVQARRSLEPDGLMIAALFGGQTLHELRSSFAEAEAEIEGGMSPRINPMGDIRDLGGLIGRAGLALPVADSQRLTVTYETPMHLMRDLRAMGEANCLTGRRKTFLRRATMDRMAEIYQNNFGQTDGRIPATFEIVFLTGWAPSATQPKPLRPGSATASLAEALRIDET
ncbi:MAG: SAM-dependent methyltransferase [Rhodobacteraceae bacterium]|nr:SAM-dependent methyltransferase [Paracoccaceae bacterium]